MTAAPSAAGLRRFRPYPEYKDSGAEWVGQIPKHWSVERLKYLATTNDEALGEGTDPNLEIVYVDISGVDSTAGITSKEQLVFENAPSRARRVVRHGDVIVSTVRTYLRAIAPIEDPEPNLTVSTGFAVMRPRRLDSAFTSYALRAPYFIDNVIANSVGVSYPAINASEMTCFPICHPELTEQRAIAAFLDRETAKIDALVAKKERLIERLQEKRSALITQAVTEGLDPNVPMKDSGVGWLGEIPAHWQLLELRYALKQVMDFRGRTPHKLGMEWGGDIAAVSAVNVRDGFIDLARGVNYGSDDLHARWMTFGPTRRGDIVYTTEAPVGNAALIPDDVPYILSQRVVLFRPNTVRVLTGFLLLLLRSSTFLQGVESQATGSTAEGIKRSHLLATPVWLPPLEEQLVIVEHVRVELAKMESLPDLIQGAITSLAELRTALISAAVTGKIDVREEVA